MKIRQNTTLNQLFPLACIKTSKHLFKLWFKVTRTQSSVRNKEMEELPLCVVSHRRATHVCPFSPQPVHTLLVLCHISLVLVKRYLPGLFI